MRRPTIHLARRKLCLCLAAAAFAPTAALASPDAWPNKAVRLIVPYAPGGLPDTVARVLSQQLTQRLGKPFVVENRPGANGVVAAQALKSSPADGYTFLVTDGSMVTINPVIYKDLSYEPKRDFVPVSLAARSPLFLAVNANVPANSLQSFIALAKSKPGQLNYGSSGIGSTHQLSMEALKAALKLDIKHIPFRGSGQSVPALIGDQVQVVFAALPSLSGFVKSGQVKILGTNSLHRSKLAPQIPAISEVVPGYDYAVTVGVLAAAGTPNAVVKQMSDAIANAVKMAEVISQLHIAGIEPVGGSSADYTKALGDETARYVEAIKVAQVVAE
ncbi:Bug family tripartite tricarboxylate transporter substrate binding protein [Cupriavidus basilensis]|uniref:Bug family tripartite tricarboxylate transporter substrate binding protein n=1 Tax=Cupriavidus basilensis TaxID=68895 RepID=UPI00157AB939|nr:tripartite tricarboxylate transporter substrate-binding protein [Cupriavidus basilensis]NUA27796.1 tripartite tricarboxylate transporter substrate binding protein [Cupriavidus basilensis]